MNCPVCANSMVKARATSFGEEYDYCRTCKKELAEMIAIPKLRIAEALDFSSTKTSHVTPSVTGIVFDPFKGHDFNMHSGMCMKGGCNETFMSFYNKQDYCIAYSQTAANPSAAQP